MVFTDPFGFSVVGNDRLLPNETDFLQSDLLPAALPVGLTGRVVLDFFLSSDPNMTASVSFEDFSVTLSP
jgi:hypothetical protein